ncbi:hypothetical protein [Flavobacterium sp.]|uniref:hypothetical protein n=1 Tax=Flavobacterium sp. TaxID=239 RepID=UPI0037505BF2
MKNENCPNNFSFFGKRKCTTNDLFKNEVSEEAQKEIISNQEMEVDLKYKLNFQLIDIDKVFAN